MTTSLLNQITNFLTAITSIYPQLPTNLHEQIKTMQAFLRSYDQKQLFLIQNFVRRLENKAEKAKNLYRRKKNDFKTQPAVWEEDTDRNKENLYNVMNIHNRKASICEPAFNTNNNEGYFKLDQNHATKKNCDVNDAETRRYKMLFENYSSSMHHSNHSSLLNHSSSESKEDNLFSLCRPISMPDQTTPSPSHPFTNLSCLQPPKPHSSPYLEAYHCQSLFQNVNSSQSSSIEPNFYQIEINPLITKNTQQQKNKTHDSINNFDKMKANVREVRQMIQKNEEVKMLEVCCMEGEGMID